MWETDETQPIKPHVCPTVEDFFKDKTKTETNEALI